MVASGVRCTLASSPPLTVSWVISPVVCHGRIALSERRRLSGKVTPLGKLPLSERVGVGNPVVVTVKALALPTVKVVLPALEPPTSAR